MGNKQSSTEGEVTVGEYRITLLPQIGSGSFGKVYKAINRSTQKTVAVKGISCSFEGQFIKDSHDMALAEAESMKRVNHPNIVSLLDFHMYKETAWLFMEYCEKGDLEKYLFADLDISLERKYDIMSQSASAVMYLHHHSPPIIHRDIKPANILMKTGPLGDVAMLTDFGFAKLYDLHLSQSGSIVYRNYHESVKGTPCYMAPEFYLEEESGVKYTATVDVFSLGLMFAVMLDFGPDNKSLDPFSVEMKRKKQACNFGYEMTVRFRKSEPLPHIVKINQEDNAVVKDIKQLILQMTGFRYRERLRISAVVQRLQEIKDNHPTALSVSLVRPRAYPKAELPTTRLRPQSTPGTTTIHSRRKVLTGWKGIQIPPETEWGSYVSCVLIILQLFPWFDDLMENPSNDSLAHYIKQCLKQGENYREMAETMLQHINISIGFKDESGYAMEKIFDAIDLLKQVVETLLAESKMDVGQSIREGSYYRITAPEKCGMVYPLSQKCSSVTDALLASLFTTGGSDVDRDWFEVLPNILVIHLTKTTDIKQYQLEIDASLLKKDATGVLELIGGFAFLVDKQQHIVFAKSDSGFVKLECAAETEVTIHDIDTLLGDKNVINGVLLYQHKEAKPTHYQRQENEIKEFVQSINENLDQAFEHVVGRDFVKSKLQKLVFDVGASRVRRSLGLPNDTETPVVLLQGNYGTGKTMIATILAEMFRHLGLTDKSSLETLTSGFRSDPGGTIFIRDIKPFLSDDDDIDNLLESINHDTKGDEKKPPFILAGSQSAIKELLDSHEELSVCVTQYFDFPDYTALQLALIFLAKTAQAQMETQGDVTEEWLAELFGQVSEESLSLLNGRLSVQLLDFAREALDTRYMSQFLDEEDGDDLSLNVLKREDIEQGFEMLLAQMKSYVIRL